MKNKRTDHISNIMSKIYDIFTENFTSFFQMHEKLEKCWNPNLTNFRRPSFGDDMNVTFISQQPVRWI